MEEQTNENPGDEFFEVLDYWSKARKEGEDFSRDGWRLVEVSQATGFNVSFGIPEYGAIDGADLLLIRLILSGETTCVAEFLVRGLLAKNLGRRSLLSTDELQRDSTCLAGWLFTRPRSIPLIEVTLQRSHAFTAYEVARSITMSELRSTGLLPMKEMRSQQMSNSSLGEANLASLP